MERFLAAIDKCPLVPVLTIETANDAGELARALLDAGLTVAEVTLRTDEALAAIEIMKREGPDLLIGAGTVLSPADIRTTLDAGSDFLVTPASTPKLRTALKQVSVPVFPGVATASEALVAYHDGFAYQKFFPAESNGGVKALKSIGAPMPEIKFMPTGGINGTTAPDYLACPNVVAVGGSWMVSGDAIKNADWKRLREHTIAAINAIAT
jgi:2-dehydro-3-deoxyphosphogluconate aldolase/(4S)-4-hydroxy-2-oxoglutarate aldolase